MKDTNESSSKKEKIAFLVEHGYVVENIDAIRDRGGCKDPRYLDVSVSIAYLPGFKPSYKTLTSARHDEQSIDTYYGIDTVFKRAKSRV